MAKRFAETGIKPEWECFCLPHLLQDPLRLINGGFDKPPYWINFVLGGERGFQNASPYTPEILDHLVAHLPKGALFCVSGIGRAQFPATTHAVLAGGHVRVGLEDNLYIGPGELATNEQLVAKMVRIILSIPVIDWGNRSLTIRYEAEVDGRRVLDGSETRGVFVMRDGRRNNGPAAGPRALTGSARPGLLARTAPKRIRAETGAWLRSPRLPDVSGESRKLTADGQHAEKICVGPSLIAKMTTKMLTIRRALTL